MQVSVRVMNGEDRELELDDDATYGDVLDRLGVPRDAAAVLVDGRPVPEGEAIESRTVTVMRTVSGGADPWVTTGPSDANLL